ncbi:MAG: hypothetical protein HYT70_04355 [Candidatus Aenigmarchaeota archaeon]|nr:hypothetical protein [Candidatus Aenigmarchaeota archaeon]
MAAKDGRPRNGELVLCTVRKVSQFAAWCDVEEYPNSEGMIHIAEVAGKWVHDIKKFVKMGKQYVVKVVRADGNTIHLSLKRVSKSEERGKWNEFRKGQRADSILKIIGREINLPIDQVYEDIKAPLQENFGDLYAAFEEIKKSPDILTELNIPKKWHEGIVKVLKKALVDKEYTIKVEMEMQSYDGDGIKRIKSILESLEKGGIHVAYVSAPKYMLDIKTKNPKADRRKLEQQVEKAMSDAQKLHLDAKYNFVEG